MASLEQIATELESHLPDLARLSSTDGFAHDVHESVEYWCRLARYALGNNTQVNYRLRAEGQLRWLQKLRDALVNKSSGDQRRYQALFAKSEEMLRLLEKIEVPKEGHLGFLKIIHNHFRFLQTEYSFGIRSEEPTAIRFSSGVVYVHLDYAKKSWLCCGFGPEPEQGQTFRLDDLLYMYGDSRYRTLPDEVTLDTEEEVENWFRLLAEILRQYGKEVLSNNPGIFGRLTDAQARRDEEYAREISREAGSR